MLMAYDVTPGTLTVSDGRSNTGAAATVASTLTGTAGTVGGTASINL
jgi:hypothetical protein